jgi:hypothetical protein
MNEKKASTRSVISTFLILAMLLMVFVYAEQSADLEYDPNDSVHSTTVQVREFNGIISNDLTNITVVELQAVPEENLVAETASETTEQQTPLSDDIETVEPAASEQILPEEQDELLEPLVNESEEDGIEEQIGEPQINLTQDLILDQTKVHNIKIQNDILPK